MKKVNIKGRNYRILRRARKGSTGRQILDGYSDATNAEIYISETTGRDFHQVLMHEMIHACFNEVGIDIPLQIEEIICESVSTMIDQNFKITPRKK